VVFLFQIQRVLANSQTLTGTNRDRRFFGFLGGFVPDAEGLNKSSLQMTIEKEGKVIDRVERPFVDSGLVMRYQHGQCVHELKPGRMEFFIDYIFFSDGYDGVYTFSAETTLPDGRVLFSFQFAIPLTKDEKSTK
jgi:hypothetical protein